MVLIRGHHNQAFHALLGAAKLQYATGADSLRYAAGPLAQWRIQKNFMGVGLHRIRKKRLQFSLHITLTNLDTVS